VLVACAHSYLLVFAAGRIRVLRDMLAKFGEMGPKPLPPARPEYVTRNRRRCLGKRCSYCGAPELSTAKRMTVSCSLPS
jgi:hypothetical protein